MRFKRFIIFWVFAFLFVFSIFQIYLLFAENDDDYMYEIWLLEMLVPVSGAVNSDRELFRNLRFEEFLFRRYLRDPSSFTRFISMYDASSFRVSEGKDPLGLNALYDLGITGSYRGEVIHFTRAGFDEDIFERVYVDKRFKNAFSSFESYRSLVEVFQNELRVIEPRHP